MMGSQDPNSPLARLTDLAEFRYQLRMFLAFSESASEAVGVAAQQYQLMQVIASTPAAQQPTISYLAERMILRHNSTVELVDRAERAGLVRRENDERDLRRSLVQLTPHGFKVLEYLVGQHLRELDARGDTIINALRNLHASGPGVQPEKPTSNEQPS
jgi:DNA-binding MarR family transcriptional regulator